VSELIERIAQGFCDTMHMDATEADKLDMGREVARQSLIVMRDAPKSVLFAGALHAATEKDLSIWKAMIDEALRE
jgi:hypothetical protein